MIEREKTKRYLRYTFNDDEKKELAKEMAQAVVERDTATAEMETVKAQFEGRITKAEGEITLNAGKINSGYEMRHIECEVTKDYKKGRVTVVRLDTGELVEDRPMTGEEKQVQIPVAK